MAAIGNAERALLAGIDQARREWPDSLPANPAGLDKRQAEKLTRRAAQLAMLMAAFNETIRDARPNIDIRLGRHPRTAPHRSTHAISALTKLAHDTHKHLQDNLDTYHALHQTAMVRLLPDPGPPDTRGSHLQRAWLELLAVTGHVTFRDGAISVNDGEKVQHAFHRYQTLYSLTGTSPDDNTAAPTEEGSIHQPASEHDATTERGRHRWTRATPPLGGCLPD